MHFKYGSKNYGQFLQSKNTKTYLRKKKFKGKKSIWCKSKYKKMWHRFWQNKLEEDLLDY